VSGPSVERAPSPAKRFAQSRLGGVLHGYNRPPGRRGPGGWWVLAEIDVAYATGDVHRHDAAGWRRDRHPVLPTAWPVKLRPDWVCEIVITEQDRQDLAVRSRVWQAAGIPHYWAVYPDEKRLVVYKLAAAGYTEVRTATSEDFLHVAPFDVEELDIAELFGEEVDQ
jgi:Uma2 family endonuclease